MGTKSNAQQPQSSGFFSQAGQWILSLTQQACEVFTRKNLEEIHIPQVLEFLEDSIYQEQTKVRSYFDCYFFWFNQTLTGYKIIWHLRVCLAHDNSIDGLIIQCHNCLLHVDVPTLRPLNLLTFIQEPPWTGSLKWPILIAHTAIQITVITFNG